jgi:hypothetical protein
MPNEAIERLASLVFFDLISSFFAFYSIASELSLSNYFDLDSTFKNGLSISAFGGCKLMTASDI